MEAKPQIAPQYLPMVQEFQRVFSRYFPNFKNDIHDAAGEMSWIRGAVFINPIETVRRSKAKDDLKKLEAFVRLVSKWDMPLLHSFCHISLEARETGDKVLNYVDDIWQFMLACEEMEDDGLRDVVLQKFITEAEKAFDRLPETRNINWEAVNAVGRMRTLWWRNTGMYAPSRALNPASLFACYLQDGFDFLEIDADPASAFRRWVAVRREEDIQYENHD